LRARRIEWLFIFVKVLPSAKIKLLKSLSRMLPDSQAGERVWIRGS
jgi:hypothetical protein